MALDSCPCVVSCCVLCFDFPCPLASLVISVSPVYSLLQFVSLCLFSSVHPPPCYLTWPPPSSLTSPVPHLIVSLCFLSCLCLFIASVWCYCARCLLQVPCVMPIVSTFWYVFAFLIWTLLFGCTLSCCFCCYFVYWSLDWFSWFFVAFSFCFNKSSPFVPPQSCLLSCE